MDYIEFERYPETLDIKSNDLIYKKSRTIVMLN